MILFKIFTLCVAFFHTSYALDASFTLQEMDVRFPHYVTLKNTDIVLCREELLGGEKEGHLFQSNHLSSYTAPSSPPATLEDLETAYGQLKMDNGLEYIKKGLPVLFQEGQGYINGQQCDYTLLTEFPIALNYVMDMYGTMWIGQSIHSHLIGGVYALCAGEVVFDAAGKIEFLSSRSGHHKPILQQLKQALILLSQKKALSDNLVVHDFNGDVLSHDHFQHLSSAPYPAFSSQQDALLQGLLKGDLPSLTPPSLENISPYLKALEIKKHHDQIIHLKASLPCMPFLQGDIDSLEKNPPYAEIYRPVSTLLHLNQTSAHLNSLQRNLLQAEYTWSPRIQWIHLPKEVLEHVKDRMNPSTREEELSLIKTIMDHLDDQKRTLISQILA